jgi:hypothetical protein
MSRISAIDAGFEASEYGKCKSVGDMLCSEPGHVDDVISVSGRETKFTIWLRQLQRLFRMSG